MREFVVLVDKKDRKLGLEEKIRAHFGQGILHRAFTVFVFDKRGRLLLQKRSKEKMLWPLFWDCSCASHPRKNERYKAAGERRLKEELGFNCPLKVIEKFQYKENYKNIGAENEICAVLIGEYQGKINPNPKEVADFKWIKINQLKKEIAKNPNKYTPWLKIGLNKIYSKKNDAKK